MDGRMTGYKWKELAAALNFRRAQLQEDLQNEDYSDVLSIKTSKEYQIDCIDTLLAQVPREFRNPAIDKTLQ